MNLPVASAPVAVLVLAWDETTPATRVLVEATAASQLPLDSVVALVPTGRAAHELSQEEFLPLEASIAPPEPPAVPEALPTELPAEGANMAATEAEATAATTEAAASSPLLPAATSPTDAPPEPAAAAEAQKPASRPSPTEPAATAVALVTPALVWQQVRVLRFGTSLGTGGPAAAGSYLGQGEPTFVWKGASDAPAAPYLGSSAAAPATQGSLAMDTLGGDSAVAAALRAATDTVATALAALRTLGPAGSGTPQLTGELPASTQPPAYLLGELPAAPDAESDATPIPLADEPAPTTELSEAAADEEAFAVDTTPVQTAEPSAPAPPFKAPPTPLVAEPEFFAPGGGPHNSARRPGRGAQIRAPPPGGPAFRCARFEFSDYPVRPHGGAAGAE
jgi:hypothetical protein